MAAFIVVLSVIFKAALAFVVFYSSVDLFECLGERSRFSSPRLIRLVSLAAAIGVFFI